jgi:hypothetical protein
MGGGGDKDDTPPVQSSGPPVATMIAPSPAPQSGNNSQTGIDKDALRRLDPNALLITLTAHGMPARVGIQAQNDSEVVSRGTFVLGKMNTACIPETQYPAPCVSYMLVKRGATVNVQFGDSRAGFWPLFGYIRGGGCDREGGGSIDRTCSIIMLSDVDMTAMYYGDTTPSGRYQYPKCPVPEERSRPGATVEPWIARCQ